MRAEESQSWFVVHSKPRQEILAVSHLERQAYETYLPMIAERRRVKGGYQVLSVPMFPRYLFVRLTPATQSTAPIRSTIGCCGLVRFGGKLAQLGPTVVDRLRMRENRDGLGCAAAAWQVGSQVRVTDGPFSGIDARFFSRSGAERVVVLMEMLGREQQVELPENVLVPLNA